MGAGIKKFSQSCLWRASFLIFATVGTSNKSFERFIKAVDNLAATISEEIIIQLGVVNYIPNNAKYFNFCSPSQMASLMDQANIIISHAGFGIIGECISKKKRLILIPREKKFNEAVDNQVELAEYLARTTKGILCIRNASHLKLAFDQINNIAPDYQFTNRIPELIQNFIDRRLS
jgi:beta-1,4-N-acetylglucosaminyltransferase